jgi:hypothetical protein
VAIGLVEQREERLHAILEAKESTSEQKFQALVDLAHLAGTLLHEVAEAESEIQADLLPAGSPASRLTGGSFPASDN